MSNAHREAAVFLACCCGIGCVGGLIVTGSRMWWEAHCGH